MIQIRGIAASEGIARGTVRFLSAKTEEPACKAISDTENEIARFIASRDRAVRELEALHDRTAEISGEEAAEIFSVHAMMLEDEDYCDCVRQTITDEKVCAEYAVSVASIRFAEMLASTGDEYIAGRAADVKDVSLRVISALSGQGDPALSLDRPVILAANDLSPSETVLLDRNMLLGIVTRTGTSSSHTAILARSMGIPAIVAAGDALDASIDGTAAIMDGEAGVLYIEPDARISALMLGKERSAREARESLLGLRGAETRTKDGKPVSLFANCGSLADIDLILENDAGGIGLLRSEFLYLEKDTFPSEDELFAMYRTVAERMGGKKVIIRTIDIGADKKASCFKLPEEENPALGLRAIRLCLSRPDIFRTQLRAILRAAAYGNVSIMFPMIISPAELRETLGIFDGVKADLDREGIARPETTETGIMIETPAAALLSAELAKMVDFFSIGSNDLTQYTLAIDRQNPALQNYADPHHEAVLALIEMTVKNAHKAGIWAGLCGELGSDLSLSGRFLSMGLDEFSVRPSAILPLRKKIRGFSGTP